MKKQLIIFLKIIRKIDWKKGSGSALFYICMMWIIALAGMLFFELYNVFSNAGRTQIYADIIADGAAYAGDTGWALDKTEATKAKCSLEELNGDDFKDIRARISFSKTDAEGTIMEGPGDDLNTVDIQADLQTALIWEEGTLKTQRAASTRITMSGGKKVVMEAYKHSWQYAQKNGTDSQTKYLWGGGHGADDLSWEQYADCSGFVSGVFRKCGYYIPAWATSGNMESMGTLIGEGIGAYERAMPGDIILFWWNSEGGAASHVAIYAGSKDGIHYMIHSKGGRDMQSTATAGRGTTGGVNMTPVSTSAARIMIRRIVMSDGTVSPTSEVGIHGLTGNEAIVYNALSDFGYSDVCIAAIMGNWKIESGVQPTTREGRGAGDSDVANAQYAEQIRNGLITKDQFIYEGRGVRHSGSEGYGLAQWTTTSWPPIGTPYLDRKARLWDFAASRGSNVTDVYTQLAFAMHEFQTTHPAINGQEFRTMTDVNEATRYFLIHYEGVGFMIQERQIAAYTYYQMFN